MTEGFFILYKYQVPAMPADFCLPYLTPYWLDYLFDKKNKTKNERIQEKKIIITPQKNCTILTYNYIIHYNYITPRLSSGFGFSILLLFFYRISTVWYDIVYIYNIYIQLPKTRQCNASLLYIHTCLNLSIIYFLSILFIIHYSWNAICQLVVVGSSWPASSTLRLNHWYISAFN